MNIWNPPVPMSGGAGVPPLTDAQADRLTAALHEHTCADCGGTGRVDSCRAAEQLARKEKREERTLTMLLAAKASVLLDLMSDRECEDFDIIAQIIGRLRRAGGGRVASGAGGLDAGGDTGEC